SGVEKTLHGKPLAIDDRSRKSGNEDEHLGRIEKFGGLQGEITQDVFRDVVDENEYQRDSAKEIEPDIALVGRFGHARLHSLGDWGRGGEGTLASPGRRRRQQGRRGEGRWRRTN